MRRSKHLPLNCIPSADVDLFREAYMPGDIFEIRAVVEHTLRSACARWSRPHTDAGSVF